MCNRNRWWPGLVALIAAFGLAQAATPAPAGPQGVMDALARANAAVVGIQVTAAEGARSAQTLGKQRRGSGVVIGADGLILTIGYLVLEADNILISTAEHKALPARAVAYDQATGFGLVQPLLPLRGVRPVPLGSQSDAQVGQMLMAASGGEDGDVGMTRLVSKRAFTGYWEYHLDLALYTTPPIDNHSGAPLFNDKGELLGIGSLALLNAEHDQQRMPGNLFVPIDLLKPILTELRQTGTSKGSLRPWLGLTSVEQNGRIQVMRVGADSPAQAAGVTAGDLVLAIDGATVSTLDAFYKKLWDRPAPDSEVRLTVLHGAQVKVLVIKAADRMSLLRKPAGI